MRILTFVDVSGPAPMDEPYEFTEQHVCPQCAAGQGLPQVPTQPQLHHIWQLLDQVKKAPRQEQGTTCPHCGMTLAEFREVFSGPLMGNCGYTQETAEAAIRGTREVGGAVVASVLTTVAVFLPIVFVEGVAGEIFKDQALTVVFSLALPLIILFVLGGVFGNEPAGPGEDIVYRGVGPMSYYVPAYLQSAGYRIIPVNPHIEEALGEEAAGDGSSTGATGAGAGDLAGETTGSLD